MKICDNNEVWSQDRLWADLEGIGEGVHTAAQLHCLVIGESFTRPAVNKLGMMSNLNHGIFLLHDFPEVSGKIIHEI